MQTLKLYSLISLFAITSCAKDPCIDVTCLNGGICDDGTCLCADWYEGEDCGTEQREKMLGEYIGYFYWSDSTFSIQSITQTGDLRVVIGEGNDINEFQFDHWLVGSTAAQASQFTLSENHANTYTGTMTFSNSEVVSVTGEYDEVRHSHKMYITGSNWYGIVTIEKI